MSYGQSLHFVGPRWPICSCDNLCSGRDGQTHLTSASSDYEPLILRHKQIARPKAVYFLSRGPVFSHLSGETSVKPYLRRSPSMDRVARMRPTTSLTKRKAASRAAFYVAV